MLKTRIKIIGLNIIRETKYTTKAIEKYNKTMDKWGKAKFNENYNRAANLTLNNIKTLPKFIKDHVKEYGSFKIKTIPTLEHGIIILSLLGRKEALLDIKKIIEVIPELKPWVTKVNAQIENVVIFKSILKAIKENPGILQTEIKHIIDCDEGRRVANLIYWLEKTGKITREKQCNTYSITLANKESREIVTKKINYPESHRVDKMQNKKCKELNLSTVPYISLPKSPYYWEESYLREKSDDEIIFDDPFKIKNNDEIQLKTIEVLSKEQKPDPAYRKIYQVGPRIILLDDLGNSEGCGKLPVSIICYNFTGDKVIEKPLEYDFYRIGTNPHNNSFIALSNEGVLHAYDYSLNPLLLSSINKYPEILRLIKKFDIEDGRLKNYTRSVCISNDMDRYIFTCVDEAWCINLKGESLWGVKMPLKDEWEEICVSKEYNTSEEIEKALVIMNLSFPLTNEEIKIKYKELAKRWHPDLNKGSQKSKEKMQLINEAAETLVGASIDFIQDSTRNYYINKIFSDKIIVDNYQITLNAEMQGDASFAADWIYASSFSTQDFNSYIGSYSGKIIELNAHGVPLRVFDIGSSPENIIHTEDYLYILTKTRLYVLNGKTLVQIIDIFREGQFILTSYGFALLQNKTIKWFKNNGDLSGTILSEAPIRRIYFSGDNMVVETRKHRAIISISY